MQLCKEQLCKASSSGGAVIGAELLQDGNAATGLIRLEAGAGAHIPLDPGLAIGEIHHRHVDAGRVWLKIRGLG